MRDTTRAAATKPKVPVTNVALPNPFRQSSFNGSVLASLVAQTVPSGWGNMGDSGEKTHSTPNFFSPRGNP